MPFRTPYRRLALLAAAAGLVAVGLPAAASAAPSPAGSVPATACTWTAKQLPLLPGGSTGAVLGTDGGSTFSGWVFAEDGQHAVLWRSGKVVDLGTYADGGTRANDVNRSGVAVGSTDYVAAEFPQVWRADGSAHALPVAEGTTGASAVAVNDAGLAVGYRYAADGTVVGMLWNTTTLTVVREYPGAFLDDIGEDNRIVGTTWPASGASRAVKTRPNTAVLTPLRSPLAGGGSLEHFGSATAGDHIVGGYVIPNSSGATAPIIWTGSSPRLLGSAGPGQARDVNALGTVVGVASDPETGQHAAIWPAPAQSPTYLPDNGEAAAASAVSNDSKRVGGTWTVGNSTRPVRWTCA